MTHVFGPPSVYTDIATLVPHLGREARAAVASMQDRGANQEELVDHVQKWYDDRQGRRTPEPPDPTYIIPGNMDKSKQIPHIALGSNSNSAHSALITSKTSNGADQKPPSSNIEPVDISGAMKHHDYDSSCVNKVSDFFRGFYSRETTPRGGNQSQDQVLLNMETKSRAAKSGAQNRAPESSVEERSMPDDKSASTPANTVHTPPQGVVVQSWPFTTTHLPHTMKRQIGGSESSSARLVGIPKPIPVRAGDLMVPLDPPSKVRLSNDSPGGDRRRGSRPESRSSESRNVMDVSGFLDEVDTSS